MRNTTRRDVADLVAAVPLAASAKYRAHTMLRGADRFYHGIDHVALLWRRHCEYAQEAGFTAAREARLIASAILFHDCIYDPSRGDNEERSAQVWLEASAASDLDAHERAWVAETIRATSDHLGYAQRSVKGATSDAPDTLRLWMLDLDLTPFGEAPDVFDRNTRLLRAEAPRISDEAFEMARLRLLRKFAAAPIIYRSAAIADRFDAPARGNLARHLSAAG